MSLVNVYRLAGSAMFPDGFLFTEQVQSACSCGRTTSIPRPVGPLTPAGQDAGGQHVKQRVSKEACRNWMHSVDQSTRWNLHGQEERGGRSRRAGM